MCTYWQIEKGSIKIGDSVNLSIDTVRRNNVKHITQLHICYMNLLEGF